MQRISSIAVIRDRGSVPVIGYKMFESAGLTAIAMSFGQNEEICGQGEDAEYVYKVLKGAVRESRILSDGRRQILAFHFPGDVFAVVTGKKYDSSAEAICPSEVLLIKRSSILRAAESNVHLARELWDITALALQRSQDHALLLVKSAKERVASFLLEMSDRVTRAGAVELPMSRQEIADYLGLTIETVSRTLTQLKCASAIRLIDARRITLNDRASLYELNA